MTPRRWDRRQLTLGLAAMAAPAACAPLRQATPALVNLAALQPELPEADGARLAAEADVARRMTVPVFLDGKGPFEFVVDTGANHTVVAEEVAGPLKLPEAGTAAVHGIAGAEAARTATVAKLAVGSVTSRRVRTPLLPAARLGAQGLLGVDVLKNRRVQLDFRRNALTIGPSRTSTTPLVRADGANRARTAFDPAVVTVPARQRFGQLIIIDADVGGQPVTAFLDSGSQNTVGNLALRQAVIGASPERAVQTLLVRLISATGQTAAGELAALPPLRLGGLRIGGLSAVFADLHVFDIWDLKDAPAILIGIDVMRHFESIELDFGKKLVVFRTPSKTGQRLTPPP